MPRNLIAPVLLAVWILLPTAADAQRLTWPDPIANHVVPYQISGLTHGPILGRPAATSMRVWVRTAEPSAFRVVYSTRLPLSSDSPAVAGRTLAARDNTGTADLKKLKPNSRYFYGLEFDGKLADLRMDFSDPWPSFRTLPDQTSYHDPESNPRGLFDVTFSIGCGASQDPYRSGGHFASPPSFATLHKQHGDEVMFHVSNGDTTYEEARDGTLAGIRNNYKLYWKRGRSFSRLFRNMPVLFTYDDHEVGWDIHGSGEIGLRAGKHLLRDPGLRVWGEYCGWANYSTPRRAPIRFGRAALKRGSDLLADPSADFSSLKPETVSTIHVGPYPSGAVGAKPPPTPRNAGVYRLVEVVDRNTLRVQPAFRADETDVVYSIGTHHYYDWKLGNCHFFALDTRGERTRPNRTNAADPKTFALGAVQRRWLMEGASNTDADFVFIISPVPWVVYHTAYHVRPEQGLVPKGDGFASFVHEREILLNFLDKLNKPVLIFTGDVHNSLAVQITDNVWEFACGPMASTAHPIGTAGGMPFGGNWKSQGRKVKIKWVAGFPDNVHYSRLRNTFYAVVQVNNVLKSARPEGTGYQFTAYDAPQVVVRFHDGYTGKLTYAEGISTADVRAE